jgi:hypothetical protein
MGTTFMLEFDRCGRMPPGRRYRSGCSSLAAHDPCSGTRAFDPNAVAYAQIRVRRLRDADLVAVTEIDQDVLPGPPLGVAILHTLANRSAGKHSGYGRNGLTGAPADRMTEHASRDAADDRAETELMIALDRHGIYARDAALANLRLPHGGRLRTARYKEYRHDGS